MNNNYYYDALYVYLLKCGRFLKLLLLDMGKQDAGTKF